MTAQLVQRQGICLMHKGARALAVHRGVVDFLVQSFPRPSESNSLLLLDLLLSFQIKDQAAQAQLVAADGFKRVRARPALHI